MEKEVTVRFDDRPMTYDFGEPDEVPLANAVTILKAPGSEFDNAV